MGNYLCCCRPKRNLQRCQSINSTLDRPCKEFRSETEPLTFSGTKYYLEKDPLNKYSWYFGSITREDAEGKLRGYKQGTYLVRKSWNSNVFPYVLSIKGLNDEIGHYRIKEHNGKFSLKSGKEFSSVNQLLSYYIANHGQLKWNLVSPIVEDQVEYEMTPLSYYLDGKEIKINRRLIRNSFNNEVRVELSLDNDCNRKSKKI